VYRPVLIKVITCTTRRPRTIGHGVAEEREVGGVAGDPAVVLHDRRAAVGDRVVQLVAAVVPVHAAADRGARRGIGGGGPPSFA